MRRARALLVAAHRALLVTATATLSVAASRVANDAEEYGSWVVVIGAIALLLLSDLLRDVDAEARELFARSAASSVWQTRADLFETRPWTLSLLALGGMAFVAGGSIFEQLSR